MAFQLDISKQHCEIPLWRKLAVELVGTFFATLVPTVVDVMYYTTGHLEETSRWLARGFLTTAQIYAFSEISGAHNNPATSVGFMLRGVFKPRRAVPYVLAQFAGAFAAAALVRLIWGSAIALGASRPGPHQSWLHAFIAEIVLTFLVTLIIFATAEAGSAVGKQAALAVGFMVATCGFVGGSISGASMNPARSVAPQIFSGRFDLVGTYMFPPCIGALLAVGAAFVLLGPPTAAERKAAKGA